MQVFAVARGFGEIENVADDGFVDLHFWHLILDLDDLGGGHCGLQFVENALAGARHENAMFVGAIGIAEADFYDEAVELVFGEIVGSFELEGVLCGDEHEGALEGAGFVFDADGFLGHCFEEMRIECGGVVRLISSAKTMLAKIGPGLEFENLCEVVVDGNAEDVAGEEIGGELDAAEFAVDAFGEVARARTVLPTPGTSSMRTCPRARRPSEQEIDGFGGAEEYGANVAAESVELLINHKCFLEDCLSREFPPVMVF